MIQGPAAIPLSAASARQQLNMHTTQTPLCEGPYLISFLVAVQIMGSQVLEAPFDGPAYCHVARVVGVAQAQAGVVDVAEGICAAAQGCQGSWLAAADHNAPRASTAVFCQ